MDADRMEKQRDEWQVMANGVVNGNLRRFRMAKDGSEKEEQ